MTGLLLLRSRSTPYPDPPLWDRTTIDARRTHDHHDGRDGHAGREPLVRAMTALCRAAAVDADLSGAVVTVVSRDGTQVVLAASDETSRARQELQFTVGEGPAADAHRAGRPVLVPELPAQNARWPAYVAAATAAGVCALHTFPLQLGALRVGVLSCYAEQPRTLSAADLSVLLDRAGEATALLLDTTGRDPDDVGRDLADAVHLRNGVFQAQGMVAEQLGVGLAEALARLRARAFALGTDLDALALEVVAGRVHLADDRPPNPDHHPQRPETEAP